MIEWLFSFLDVRSRCFPSNLTNPSTKVIWLVLKRSTICRATRQCRNHSPFYKPRVRKRLMGEPPNRKIEQDRQRQTNQR